MKQKEAELEKLKSKSQGLKQQLTQKKDVAIKEQVNSIVQTELSKAMTNLKQSWDAEQKKQQAA